jgi:creatinine amidohydrolase
MLYLRKELVGPIRVDHPTPPRAGIYTFPIEASKISSRGVLGNTSFASAENGRALFEEICSQLIAIVRERMV